MFKLMLQFIDRQHQRCSQMGACQNQFHNVPEQIQVEHQNQFQTQHQRFTINSIKLQHKAVRPNSRNVTIGMIDTKIQSIKNQKTLHSLVGQNKSKSFQFSPEKLSTFDNNVEEPMFKKKDIDRQQLHATKRPFQDFQKITLGQPDYLQPKVNQKNRQVLDLTFYYSLALPEFTYPPLQGQQFKNLMVCQQQQRNGVKYIGQWKDLKTVHGNGVMQSNTTKYIGQFNNGLKHFYGRQIQKNQVYQGQFSNGRRKGKGKKYTLQSYEEGIFDQYLIKGKIIYNNGNVYQGELKNNKYHGQGKFTQKAHQNIYQGQFKNGKLHGEGKIIHQNKVIYSGGFLEGLKHGNGQFNWSETQYYKGEYSRGKKHGMGELCTGKLRYAGSFLNGKMNGIIRVYDLNNRSYQVQYQNGIKKDNYQNSYYEAESQMPKQWRDALLKKQSL